jgi:hypothetical protein
MDRMRALTLPLAFTAATLSWFCATAYSQAPKETQVNAEAPPEKALPPAVREKPYFSDSLDPRRSHSIEFRTVDQMTEHDRLIAANAEGSIGELSKYTGLEFNQGAWTYEQVVCPALPGHIFLRFLRNNGTGDVSVFTASVPRGEEGRVRLIPIQLRGYSLFSPAPINAITISTFNHIRGEESPDPDGTTGHDPDWLGTALCYAALAGGHPQAAQVSDHPETQKYPIASTALMQVGDEGGAVIAFTDVSMKTRPMKWSLTFDKKGKLVKGGHSPADLMAVTVTHPLPVDKIGPPMQMTQPKVKTMNPPLPAVVTQQVPPGPQTITQVPAGNPPS